MSIVDRRGRAITRFFVPAFKPVPSLRKRAVQLFVQAAQRMETLPGFPLAEPGGSARLASWPQLNTINEDQFWRSPTAPRICRAIVSFGSFRRSFSYAVAAESNWLLCNRETAVSNWRCIRSVWPKEDLVQS